MTTNASTPDSDCPTPTTVHGLPVLKAYLFPAWPGAQRNHAILVDNAGEYVTAILCVGSESWLWGHYFDSLTEAAIDFDARVKRGY